MKLHSADTAKMHREILEDYKERLAELEQMDNEEQEEPFERSYLHNAIHLHTLWFEQLEGGEKTESPLLEEILERRDSDLGTFETWMSDFAWAAQPHGWAVWGWSYPLKTFVGFPIRNHDDSIPLGVTPILVIDCWEHSYVPDFGNDFESYLQQFWVSLNYHCLESRHQELAQLLGFDIK
jgi:Fe-Mn family superoxide dismutase